MHQLNHFERLSTPPLKLGGTAALEYTFLNAEQASANR
jgi:hypothetical protein